MILEIRGISLFAAFSGADEKKCTIYMICKTTLKSTHQIRSKTSISPTSENAGIKLKVCREYDVLQ